MQKNLQQEIPPPPPGFVYETELPPGNVQNLPPPPPGFVYETTPSNAPSYSTQEQATDKPHSFAQNATVVILLLVLLAAWYLFQQRWFWEWSLVLAALACVIWTIALAASFQILPAMGTAFLAIVFNALLAAISQRR